MHALESIQVSWIGSKVCTEAWILFDYLQWSVPIWSLRIGLRNTIVSRCNDMNHMDLKAADTRRKWLEHTIKVRRTSMI